MDDLKGSRSITGRGAAGNPKNRFERIEVEPAIPDGEPRPETVYLRDHSRSIIARNESPDIGFDASINPYRGCSHGCVLYRGRRVMEPRTSRPVRRLAAIERLAGIPIGVMTAPVIPGITDHELPNLISAAAEAGAVRPLFEDWLSRHFPDRKEKVLNRIRSMRGGRLNDPDFGSRMRREGIVADHIAQLFDISCRRAGIERGRFPKLSTAAFRREGQPRVFD